MRELDHWLPKLASGKPRPASPDGKGGGEIPILFESEKTRFEVEKKRQEIPENRKPKLNESYKEYDSPTPNDELAAFSSKLCS